MMRIRKQELWAQLPPEWPEPLLPAIQQKISPSDKVIVLDDDPTGTQTVHDIPVLTEWSVEALRDELRREGTVIYLLTNSRSLSVDAARALNAEIATNLRKAAEGLAGRIALISRSDSTLRGHYPAEIEALKDALGQRIDGVLVIPFFLEGGRYTIGNVHYVEEGEWLVPAGETEFARDATFGYRASDLKEWVAEKHGGTLSPADVAAISLEEIRFGGPDAVAKRLASLANAQVCVVNAASYRDLEVVVMALLALEDQGQRFLYRTAASFVRVRGGITPHPLLTPQDLRGESGGEGGLILVGSYVQRTTQQLEQVRNLEGVVPIEVAVPLLLGAGREGEILRVCRAAERVIAAGQDALVYTSRTVVKAPQGDFLDVGRRVSQGLVSIVQGLAKRPAWIIAKGGITSSDIATAGLGVRRAWVLGQAIPGVPIWRLGPESRWPGLVYVVFPGNVGGPTALADMVRILRG